MTDSPAARAARKAIEQIEASRSGSRFGAYIKEAKASQPSLPKILTNSIEEEISYISVSGDPQHVAKLKRLQELKEKISDIAASISDPKNAALFASGLMLGFEIASVSLFRDLLSQNLKSLRSEGGKESARKRNAKAEETWRSEFKQLAIRLRKAKPRLSQGDLVTEILNGWKGEKIPGFDSAILQIRRLEKAGELPKRSKG